MQRFDPTTESIASSNLVLEGLVYAALCEKLVDTSADLKFVPRLAPALWCLEQGLVCKTVVLVFPWGPGMRMWWRLESVPSIRSFRVS